MDQGSTMKRSAVHNFAPTVTKFCVMWEGQALPHDTKFGNSRCEIVGRRVIFIWSLIHGLCWSGLIKAEPGFLYCQVISKYDINTLWPSNIKWWYKARSTSAQVMACCLTTPSHILNQYWPIISTFQWHSSKSTLTGIPQLSITKISLKIPIPGINELTAQHGQGTVYKYTVHSKNYTYSLRFIMFFVIRQ